MDKKQEYLDISLKHLQIADHIAYITFPLVNEKRLLLKIFEEIHKSIINLITAVLISEHQKKDASPHLKECDLNGARFLDARESPHSVECGFQDSRHKKNRIKLYKDNNENIKNFIKVSKDYNINQNEIKKIIEILEINEKHRNSSMEFTRKDKVIIMLDNLKTFSLDIQKIKEYLSLSKSLYIRINLILNN